MNQVSSDLLQFLRSPGRLELLQMDSSKRALVSQSNDVFPIKDGIPHFAEESSVFFDQHWLEHQNMRIPPAKLNSAHKFLKPLLEHFGRQEEAILDAGCGYGAHLCCLSSQAGFRCRLVALDISTAALQNAQALVKRGGYFVQGSVLGLPFADETFDAVYSFGVLAYTTQPRRGFAELCRVTKRGGLVGVWFYPQRGGICGAMFSLARALCKTMGPAATRLIADLVVPFLGALPTSSGMHLGNARWNECREVVLVSIGSETLYLPTPADILAWFSQEKLRVVNNDLDMPISLWGEKTT